MQESFREPKSSAAAEDWEECWLFAWRAYKAKGHVVSTQWLKVNSNPLRDSGMVKPVFLDGGWGYPKLAG